MRIPAAFATYDQCSQERDGSMSYNVQAAFLSEGFLGGPTPSEHPWRIEQHDEEGGEGMEDNLEREQGDPWKGGGKEVVEMLKRRQPALELKTMRVACSIYKIVLMSCH